MFAARSTGLAVLIVALGANAPAQQSPASPATPPQAKPAFEVQVVTLEPVRALVLPMKGSYSQHPDAFARIGGFLSQRGVEPTGAPFARYFSDPSVGEANLLWEVGFPVPADAPTKAPFEIKELPATVTAVHVHRGPIEELGTAWPRMIEWVFSNGYQIAGPATQVFKGDMAASPEVEMRIAVQK
jgi:effector-binding domain-containing protein